MGETASRLIHLVNLAKEPAEDKRRQLLQEVTDLFFDSAPAVTTAERGLFGDVMSRMLPEMETRVRQALAERLAREAKAPEAVIRLLAHDEIAVARPVLAESPVLTDADLLDVVERHGQEHLMAVSGRPTVSEAVADRLVEKGDDRVVESLVRNAGARLSRQAFETVARRAETSAVLQAPLVGRADAPPDVLHRVFWVVSSDLRQRILAATAAIDEAELDRLLAESEAAVTADLRPEAADPAYAAAEQLISTKEALGQLGPELLTRFLRQNQLPAFVVGFARLTRIDVPTARRVLSDADGEAAAIACKAVGFDRAYFSNLMLMTDRAGRRRPEDMQRLLGLYDQLPVEAAQRAMRFWRVRRKGREGTPAG